MIDVTLHNLITTELHNENYKKAIDTRVEIISGEMGYKEEYIVDEQDQYARHFIIHTDDVEIGSVRVFRTNDVEVEFSYFAVKKKYRKQGFASKFLHDLMNIFNEVSISINVILPAVDFFEKNGFKTKGKEIDIHGTKGIKMYYKHVKKPTRK